ncbi:hypothetical protein K450DRAFT_242315 [Umbelopsis ramanniana AG]|uniref:VanZ-like domain-containing protein n=1 Tax=Umbelopsis ramanniana AG TaxID=1314678 RepID=A0AAD5E8W4_UMBRA|nr:uncharacterized protein K450DRAFT_242315 [Umbelopsis ramanniana AG]KAI8579471.1 hypothetical protein K450DRAFT_242315 [Umbelopsis ramanniana AG]
MPIRMPAFKMRMRVLVVLVILLVLMAILGFAPISLDHINDKLLHSTCFGIFSFTIYWVWNLDYKKNLGLSAVAMLIMSFGSEFIQGLLPYRTFDGYDIVANLVGSCIGILLACGSDYAWTSWQERKRRRGGLHEAEYQRALMDENDLTDDEDRRFDSLEMV